MTSHSNSIHPKEQWSCLQEKKYYTFMAWKMNTVLIYLNLLPMFVQSHQEYWEFLYHLNILSMSNTCICSNIMFKHWIIQSDNLSQTGNFNHCPLNLKSSGNLSFLRKNHLYQIDICVRTAKLQNAGHHFCVLLDHNIIVPFY